MPYRMCRRCREFAFNSDRQLCLACKFSPLPEPLPEPDYIVGASAACDPEELADVGALDCAKLGTGD